MSAVQSRPTINVSRHRSFGAVLDLIAGVRNIFAESIGGMAAEVGEDEQRGGKQQDDDVFR